MSTYLSLRLLICTSIDHVGGSLLSAQQVTMRAPLAASKPPQVQLAHRIFPKVWVQVKVQVQVQVQVAQAPMKTTSRAG